MESTSNTIEKNEKQLKPPKSKRYKGETKREREKIIESITYLKKNHMDALIIPVTHTNNQFATVAHTSRREGQITVLLHNEPFKTYQPAKFSP